MSVNIPDVLIDYDVDCGSYSFGDSDGGSGDDDGSAAPLSIFESSAPPTVEFPVSPTEEEYRSLPALVQERLQIEELTMTTMEED